ncbi:MAG: EscU/YscU/HrcU family type III secretion system export apparatus switch protein, partial [Armatimonadota bacterium]
DAEGSAEVKMAIAKRRMKLLRGGVAKKVREADVIITNPTHFAIAIKYERNSMHAPVVLAKGQDFLALKMREIAKEAKVPIVENKPLARALYRLCEAGDFVPRDLFGPVAEVLAYVYKSARGARR